MKNTFGKILIGALVFSAVALPVSARGYGNRNNNNVPQRMQPNGRQSYNCPMGAPGMGMRGAPKMNNRMGGTPQGAIQKSIMGTIKSFDEKNGILEIEDADKKVKKVHINPQTFVSTVKRPTAPTTTAPAPKAYARPEFSPIEPPAFKDVFKIGVWVTVKDFPTETETREARRIMIQQ